MGPGGIETLTVLVMEVPCCSGLMKLVGMARACREVYTCQKNGNDGNRKSEVRGMDTMIYQ